MPAFEELVSQGYSAAQKHIVENIMSTPDKYKRGGTHEMYSIKSCDDIVVKRVLPKAEMINRCGGDKNKAIQRLQDEHAYVAAYLPGYVPRTVFMEADFGQGDEWFMVQERATGHDFWDVSQYPTEYKTHLSQNFRLHSKISTKDTVGSEILAK
ncbi:MAG: hypothetical protein HQK53_17155 [Oligoflexia bacterium]|nr:hypothetical protein [Oligoflexia bacterium]